MADALWRSHSFFGAALFDLSSTDGLSSGAAAAQRRRSISESIRLAGPCPHAQAARTDRR